MLAAIYSGGSTNVQDCIQYEHDLNMPDIPSPVSISKLNKFERQNPHTSVDVFGYEDKELFPMRITKQKGRLHPVIIFFL